MLLLHDLVIHRFDVIDLLTYVAHVILGDKFGENVGLEVLHCLNNVLHLDRIFGL